MRVIVLLVVVIVVRRVVVELKQPFVTVFDFTLVLYVVVGDIRLQNKKMKIVIMMTMGTLCIQEYSFLQSQCCLPPQSLVLSPD